MKLEFKLPEKNAEQITDRLRRELKNWAYAHITTCTTAVNNSVLTVEFAREQDYAMFAISWHSDVKIQPKWRL